ncbi:hypothetical protein EU537_11930 [Candidatus Thorarchaeota archaeon]|nr:MAG: hypothetical protein EU537_11930 [Candidatus Thorarchaeota archaeon]
MEIIADGKRVLRFMILFLCYLWLGILSVVTILYLFLESSTLGWLIAMFYPSIAPMLFILVVGCGFIIIRFSFLSKKREIFLVSIVCTFIFIGMILPYAAIPLGISDAESQMQEVYGELYDNLDTTGMKQVPYSLYDDLYGLSIDGTTYSVQYDIPYLDNGDDTLYFDWYCPVGEGPFPVIITIHGGAWVIGNKGFSNIPLFNHYFASKGYAIFDIQYGLFDPDTLPEDQSTALSSFANLGFDISPNYNRSYTMEAQIENVGEFTKVLELNRSKYKADIDHVFVAGRSAGGHLASLVTLGYKNPLYEGNFSTGMKIEGGIWYYPVTNVTRGSSGLFDALVKGDLPIEDQYTKLFAANLITNSSVVPPIMILHGSKDGLADYETQGLSFYEYALSLGDKCILVTIPWAGHGFDYDFNGFGGQISTYYVERFMALELLED